MKKRDNETINPKIHRRLLDFFNVARTAEDLRYLPANAFDFDEEHVLNGPNRHERLDGIRGLENQKPVLSKKWAQCLIDERDANYPVQGFVHVENILDVLGKKRFRNLYPFLTLHFGHATYGEWRDAGRVETEDESVPIAHAAMLCSGAILFIEAACNIPVSRTPLWTLHPDNTTSVEIPPAPADNLYCSGHCFVSDGKLLVVGGGGENGQTADPNMAWLFDPDAKTWDFTRTPSGTRTRMHENRWYPTAVTLGDQSGRVLIASGHPSRMEIYSESSGAFHYVTATGGDKDFDPLYPGLHLLPGGEIFFAPTGFRNSSGGPANDSSNDLSGYFTFGGSYSGSWTDTGANDRTKGMSVQVLSQNYPFVTIMIIGGGDNSRSRTSQVINLSTLSPSWQGEQSLPKLATEASPTSRINVNVVLLPDNTVFVSGGTSANQPCWLYDPASGGSWSRMDNLSTERAYHSLAILLPTAEVLTTGSRSRTDAHNNLVEIFSPPYLYNANGTKATRPVIGLVPEYPAPIHHGSSFTIETDEADEIEQVVLVRPMAVTHQTDSEQRVIHLTFAKTGATTLTATAPNGWHPHAMAPAGCYMLFIINTSGVPSVAKFVLLH